MEVTTHSTFPSSLVATCAFSLFSSSQFCKTSRVFVFKIVYARRKPSWLTAYHTESIVLICEAGRQTLHLHNTTCRSRGHSEGVIQILGSFGGAIQCGYSDLGVIWRGHSNLGGHLEGAIQRGSFRFRESFRFYTKYLQFAKLQKILCRLRSTCCLCI